jgi:myo-inositol-1(or 4)-monophosphatase
MGPGHSAELVAVRELARAAGGILMENLGDVGRIEQKAATEFVTDVDRMAEDMLLERLARLYPDDRVLAEESGARESAGAATGRTWYVDPLDGTTNYAHGHPFFAVSIACADIDGLRVGAVYAPYIDELYLAERGRGAVLERPAAGGAGRRLGPLSAVPLERALLATGFPYLRDETVDLNTGLVRDFLKAPCHGIRRGGSAALDLAHVAAGTLDGFWEFHLRPWDSAAGTLIAREAGAVVTDVTGRGAAMHYENILAAAPGLHARMVALLGGRLPRREPAGKEAL